MLGALLAAVLVPTACVLWFMTTAMRNERWAVRQRLTQTYRRDLREATDRLSAYGSRKLVALAGGPDAPAPERFARMVRTAVADSVVIRSVSGKLAFPVVEIAGSQEPDATPGWAEAAKLEQTDSPAQLRKAAEAYAKIADRSEDVDRKALALQARVRCLVKAGRAPDALAVLTGPMSAPALRDAIDPEGRRIVPSAMLLALELMGDSGQPAFGRMAEDLARRLNDYAGPPMLSRQRRFLTASLSRIAPEAGPFPTSAAEDLAAGYLAGRQAPPEASRLTATGLPGLWHLAGRDKSVVAIFRHEKLLAELSAAARLRDPPAGTVVRLVPPGPSDRAEAAEEAFLSVPAGEQLPGWQLRLHLAGDNPFAAAADRQRTAYLWTGTLGIVVIVLFALIVARHLGRQIRLTRLKNDLIATVSHELKTPLTSMRAMVETLLAGRCKDRQKELEYFALIAKENERLSRLIDNFLTFSRMERNRRTFESDELRAADLVAEAVASMAEKFDEPGCHLDVDVESDLPTILGDRDALITVLLNLLSNAYKYTGQQKHIAVRAYADGPDVCLAVTDNGIGLSRRAARKVFDRFYQVDQRVSRGVGGCGLGLSIVRFVVDAHGGSVDVVSRPGQGSTFVVRLPAERAPGEEPNEP